MASTIGSKLQNVVVTIIVGLLVLAFAVWGVNDMFQPKQRNAVALIGDTEVSAVEFRDRLQDQLRTQAQQTGEGLTNEEAFARGMHRQLLQQMTTDAAIRADARDLGVSVNRRDVKREIEGIDAFQSEITGQFSEDKYLQTLNRVQRNRKDFERDLQRDLERDQTVTAVVEGIRAPSGYAKRFYDFVSEQRRASVLTLTEAAIDPIETPNDETLKAYIDTNGARYMAPEYRKMILLRLEPSDFAFDTEVTDQQVRDQFDLDVDGGLLGKTETRDVTLLTINTEASAIAAAERINGGETAASVADGLGLGTPEVYTDVSKDGLVDPSASTAAFELETGQAKAVLGSLGQWLVVQVSAISPAVVPNFAELEPEIRAQVTLAEAKQKISEIYGQVEDRMLENETLVEIAQSMSLPLAEYDYFDRTGTTRDGVKYDGSARIPGIARDDEILRMAFTSDMGFETDLFETTQEGVAALQITDIIDTTMRPFEDVKADAIEAWKAEQLRERLLERGAELLAEVRGGKSLEDVAKDIGAGATLDQIGIARANPPRDIGSAVTVELLKSAEGETVRGDGAIPGTYQIARLDRIIPNADGLAGEFLDVMQERSSSEISGDIQTAYQAAILREHELREFPGQVRAVLGVEDEE